MVLGITGAIAAGKSLVSELFRQRGAAVVSADELAREAVARGSRVLDRLVERFGPGILAADGCLDRAAMADIVFADPGARADLEAIVHPAIAALAERRLAMLRNSGVPLIVYEAPLLFEAGAQERVDRVLVVRIDPRRQLRRLMERDDLDEAAARARISAQMPQEDKVARADFVIDNSGNRAATEAQVDRLWALLTGAGS